jgi:hypothetical protein
MVSTLLPDEQLVINSLRQYDCLKKEQLIQLLHYKPREVAEKIINSLIKRQLLIVDESGNVKHDPRCDYSFKTEMAFWVLLKYIEVVKPDEHYKANYPSEIYFLKEKNQYEIVVLRAGEEHLLGPLSNTDRSSGDLEDESDEMRYIVAVPTATMIPACKAKLKNVKVLFVVYPEDGVPGEAPDLQFVKAQ